MPKVHGKNSVIFVTDSGGTCRNISGDMNNIVLSWSKANVDVTTFGLSDVDRIPGIRDATLTGAGFYNETDTTGIHAVLQGIMAASTATCINFAPAGSVSGCQLISGCYLISSYEITGPIGGAVAATFSFEQTAGSLIFGTVA